MSAPASPQIAQAPLALRTGAWADYALLDSGAGRKLERYGRYRVVRPEPQCLWRPSLGDNTWAAADAVFDPEGEDDDGRWRFAKAALTPFPLTWRGVTFEAVASPRSGIWASFPEQAANWDSNT